MEISRDLYDTFEDFADKRVEGSRSIYKRRGELRDSKMKKDIITGLCGEYNPFLTRGDELRDFSRTMCNWSGKGIVFSDFEGFITTAESAGCMEVCSGQGN